MFNLTKKQKNKIRSYWSQYKLRFCKNGSVLAQKSENGAWGVLYTPEQLARHCEAIGA